MEKPILFFISFVGIITWGLICYLAIQPWKLIMALETQNNNEKRKLCLKNKIEHEYVVRSIYMGVATLLILLVLYIFS